MDLFLLIHTENKVKLKTLLEKVERHPERPKMSIAIHSKGYAPWLEPDLMDHISKFKQYSVFPTEKSKISSLIELITIVNSENVIMVDEDNPDLTVSEWNPLNLRSLCANAKDLMKLNLDTKYKNLKWFIVDLFSQRNKKKMNVYDDGSEDCKRYLSKVSSPFFMERIIHIDGGMGDHIMSLPLLEKLAENCYICCKYPFVYEHLKFKGYIDWNDALFGGYDRIVYGYGNSKNSTTIIDAFFEIYSEKRESSDVLRYNGKREANPEIPSDRNLALICTSAAKINGLDSNKNWRDIRWLKLIHHLKNMGYLVIQVGSKKDDQIPNADLKFLDKPLANLAKLIEDSSLWISVDTFFHHFASSIKPEVGICLTPFYNDHAKHPGVTYIEKDCGKDFSYRRWWLDAQQPERKECMDLIQVEDVLSALNQ